MAKIRIFHKFGITPNHLLCDRRISWKAKGLYGYIQSKPDNWDFAIERFEGKDGKDSTRAGIQELEQFGYLERVQKRQKDGTFEIEYVLHEAPIDELTVAENPPSENPTSENPPCNKEREDKKGGIILYNTNVLNKTEGSEFGNKEINEMQSLIKQTVSDIRLFYKAGQRERQRIKNILTGKEYGELCEKVGMSRSEFLVKIFQMSAGMKFWYGKIYNAETFYSHYIKIYNDGASMARPTTTIII